MFIHLSGELSFQFLCFFQVRSDFLFFPEFSVCTLSDKRKTTKIYPWHITETNNNTAGFFVLFQSNRFKIIQNILNQIQVSIKIWMSCFMGMTHTHRRYLISALKLASAAWWIPFLATSSSFSSAMVRSLRLSFPSRLKFKACKKMFNYILIFFANISVNSFCITE